MTIRFIGPLLGGAAFVLVAATGALAQTGGKAAATKCAAGFWYIPGTDTCSKKNPNDNGKSNTTTVKSSKSNSSDRMGGGGGGKGAVKLNPQPEPPGSKAK